MTEPILRQLLDCLGEADAARLLGRLGGTRMEIPSRAENSALAKIVGRDGAQRLIDEIGPGRVTLPMGRERGTAGRRVRAKKKLTEGASVRDVALACDLHVRTVERYRAELRDDRQIDLPFED